MAETSGFDGYNQFLYKYACRFVRGKRVLDVCCGIGRGAAMMADSSAKRVVGVDYSRRAVAEAAGQLEGRNNLAFLVRDITAGINEELFDIAVFFNAVEHFSRPEQEAILSRIGQLLAEDGVLLLATNNKTSAGFNPYHKNELGPAEFKELCAAFFCRAEFFGIKQKFHPGFDKQGARNKLVNSVFRPRFMQRFIQPMVPRSIKDAVNARFLHLLPTTDADFAFLDDLEPCEFFLAVCHKGKAAPD